MEIKSMLPDDNQVNKELMETLKAIRETLVALQAQAQVGDAKKLADDVEHSGLWINYGELMPFMNGDQRARIDQAFVISAQAEIYFRTGKDHLTAGITKYVPLLLADLDDIAKQIENKRSSSQRAMTAADEQFVKRIRTRHRSYVGLYFIENGSTAIVMLTRKETQKLRRIAEKYCVSYSQLLRNR
jgi:hypothetical protein